MILCHLINLTRKQHHHGRLIALIGFRGTIRQTHIEGHFCKTRPMVFYTRSRNQAKISLAPWIKIKRHDSELGSFYQKGHFNIYYLHLFNVCVCVHPCVQAHVHLLPWSYFIFLPCEVQELKSVCHVGGLCT